MAARKGGTVSESSANGRREVQWVTKYGDLVAYAAERRRLPREIANPVAAEEVAENHLAGWVRYQRRREELGVMPGWQRLLLSQVAGFSWDPMGEQWDATCAELEDFLKTQKRVPPYRTTMESERALAAWVHKQRHLNGKGLLPAHRVAALRKLPFRIL